MTKYGNFIRDKVYSSMVYPLGAKLEEPPGSGKVYKFVKYNDGDGDVTAVAGRLVVGLDSAFPAGEVTMDYSSSTVPAIGARPEGFLQAAPAHGQYCWSQVHGDNDESMLTDGSVAQGDRLMKHATTDGGVDTHDDTSALVVGVAKEADTGTALTAGQAEILIETL
jgi:hypothetical protein